MVYRLTDVILATARVIKAPNYQIIKIFSEPEADSNPYTNPVRYPTPRTGPKDRQRSEFLRGPERDGQKRGNPIPYRSPRPCVTW